MEDDFVIDQASWHTKKQRNYELDSSIIYNYFKGIINYLQENKLTTRIILYDVEKVDDDTHFKKSDLTEEGLELIKKAYGKWVDAVVDKKKSPYDYKILDKALSKIRNPLK